VLIIPPAGRAQPPRPAESARLRAQFGAGAARPFIVGHVGALVDAHKGQLQVIELARRLAGRLPDLRTVFVGSGPDEAAFRAAAAGLPNVHFAGHTDAVGDYLGAFDLFIYPSRHEGLGSVLIDALDFGLPVVATAVGGIPEIIGDGQNGILCQPGDIDALERAVLCFHDDATLRLRVANANRRRAAEFSADAMTARYSALYRELAGGGIALAMPAADAP
jgi:glycosyltransferase involved in cell wall biosynthesis